MENNKYQHKEHCKKCNKETDGMAYLTSGVHHAGWRCNECNSHKWLPKPDTDITKYKRHAEHKNLVKKYSKGFCEWCTISEESLKKEKNRTLHAHHIIEYDKGGSHERDNIMILCTKCHMLNHWTRIYTSDPATRHISSVINEVLSNINQSDNID